MRTIRRSNRFKRDFRRVKRGMYQGVIEANLNELLVLLRSDAPIPPNYRDHPLHGEWRGHRECHVHGDLVLIYRKVGDHELRLARIGSHSQLGLA